MKKIILFGLFASIILSACDHKNSAEYKALLASKDSLQKAYAVKEKEATEYWNTINEVEQNLEQIKIAQGFVTADQGENTADARMRIQNNINLINNLLAENKAKIEELEKKSQQVDGLSARVNSLRKQVTAKEKEIEELKKQLADRDLKIRQLDSTLLVMNDNLNTLSSEKQIIESIAVEQDEALHTGYYFFGTTKQLKNKGIDVKKRSLNRAAFTKVDTRDATTFNLNTKSAMVLTNHPAGSYKINVVNKNATLEIINPTEFWSVSKYLVVKVK